MLDILKEIKAHNEYLRYESPDDSEARAMAMIALSILHLANVLKDNQAIKGGTNHE